MHPMSAAAMTRMGLADNIGDSRQRQRFRTFQRHRGDNLSPGYEDRALAPVDDAVLLAGISDGDRRALEVLYERHAGWILIRLERRCGDHDLADLALQDTFISVWKSAARWRGDGEVAAWLWGIAIRRLIDQIRKSKRTPRTVQFDRNVHSHIGDTEPTPEQETVDRSMSPEMSTALGELSPELLDVVLATTVDGLTNKEAALMLAIPIGTLKTRARKARAILQESLR